MATAILASLEPWRIAVCAILAMLAMGYVPLKKLVSKNLIATAAWTIAVITLPAFAPPSFHGEYMPAAACVALLMFANTTLCDLASINEDRLASVRSVSVCYGAGAAAWSAFFAAALGTGIAYAWEYWSLSLCAAGHAGLAIFYLRREATRWTRIAADAVLVLIPGPLALLFGR